MDMKKDLGENIKVLMTLEEEQREETKATGKYRNNNNNKKNNNRGGATLSSSQIRAFIGLCNHVPTFILLFLATLSSTRQASFLESQVQICEWYLSSFMSANEVFVR